MCSSNKYLACGVTLERRGNIASLWRRATASLRLCLTYELEQDGGSAAWPCGASVCHELRGRSQCFIVETNILTYKNFGTVNKITMRDNQTLMIEFVNIIKKYPEIYDATLDTYRSRFSEMAWTKVASQVKSELNEECTLEELKMKWKGIRSSYNRYRTRMNMIQNDNACKKYYLYDHLRFLEPFLKCNLKALAQDQDKSETSINDPCNYVNADGIEASEYSVEEWNQIEIKPDLTGRLEKQDPDAASSSEPYVVSKKRKFSFEGPSNDDDNEDLTFFKSILPDIRNFTIKEKRKLKMGILQLIDEIEKDKET